jgi:superfamily II DNA or RNA helicase
VRLIRARLQGVIILPCGGGKTRLGVGAIPSIGRATLVLAHTDDLLDQWVATARALLRPVDGSEITIGLMNAERKETEASIVVGSVKTVDAYLKVHPEWGRRFGFVILDEAHHAPAETFQSVLMRLPARWRLGLTATIDREDGLTKFIDWSFGPRLLEKDAPELIALGHLMRPELEFVSSAFEFAFAGPDRKKGAALDLAIENDEARNALIAELAARDGKAGETVLVLAQRKTHCRALCRLIWEAGQEAAVLIGTTRKTARRDTIEGMRDGGVRVVVATSLADEGLDVQRLSRIVLAYPQRAKAPTIQRLGRLMRRFEGKKPRLYDIVDPLVDTLASRASARKRVYRQLGILR